MFVGIIDNNKYNGKICFHKAKETVILVILLIVILVKTTPLLPIPGPFTVS